MAENLFNVFSTNVDTEKEKINDIKAEVKNKNDPHCKAWEDLEVEKKRIEDEKKTFYYK